MHSEGNVFATASEDESCRIFDVRADQELVKMGAPGCKYSSVGLSSSCRLLLAGGEDNNVHMFDSIKGCEAGKSQNAVFALERERANLCKFLEQSLLPSDKYVSE